MTHSHASDVPRGPSTVVDCAEAVQGVGGGGNLQADSQRAES